MNRHLVGTLSIGCLLFVWISIFASAQQPITGIPPLSSVAGGPFDTVDLANLNVHFSIPVFSRPGKGISLSYNLSYDSLIWAPVYGSGGTLWTPVTGWGWRGSTEMLTGYVTYGYIDAVTYCGQNWGEYEEWSSWVYHDPQGVPHPFSGYVRKYNDPGCGSDHIFTKATATDNSGYVLHLPTIEWGEDIVPTTVTSPSGLIYSPPSQSQSGAGSVTDPNGNTITISSVGGITDTLGPPAALNISGTNPVTYSYAAPGATAKVQVTYSNYMVATHFNVNGVAEYHYPNGISTPLVSSITLADNSQYTFAYEPTYGGTQGTVTGRIASVTLPTGGTITYAYNGTNSMMADGSPSTMTRALSGGTWIYDRFLQPPGTYTQQTYTTVIDPLGNYTDIYFSGIYETAQGVYTGDRLSFLDYSFTCYNSNLTGCPTAMVGSPISRRTISDYPSYPSSLFSEYDYSYDPYGNLTGETDYDYATTNNPTLKATSITYNTPLCTGHNICDHPASVQILDGSSHQKAYTTYTYDNGNNTNGNVTSVSKWVGTGLSNLVWQYSYNTGSGGGGTLNSATDPNGTVTSYSYTSGSCNNAFPTSVTVQTLPTSYTYNCTGGVVTSVKDPNNNTVSTSYSDSYYWRPASVSDQMTPPNTTNYTYPSVGQVEAKMTFSNGNSGNSTTDTLTAADNLGRPYLQQTQDSSGWDTVQYSYDTSGRLQYLFRPFVSTYGQGTTVPPGSNFPATTYSYDALNRYLNITDFTGIQTNYSYKLNDTTVTVTGGPSQTRQYESDGLGRLISACEVTSATSAGCGQNNGTGVGYKTAYTYDPLGNLTNAVEAANVSGSQTRTFSYDGLSRMISEFNPETSSNGTGGTTSYTYDSDSTCGTASILAGNKVKRVDPAGNVSCYAWDGLHRLTSVTYPSGPNASNMPGKYYVYDWAQFFSLTLNNPLGRLTEAYTQLGQNTYSAEAFSYNARGEATDFYEATPHGGAWYHVQQGYFANGMLGSLQGFTGTGTTTAFSDLFNYNLDGEGRPYGMVDASNNNNPIWSSTTYNAASQPLIVSPAAGGTESFGYDGNSGRTTQWLSTAGSQYQTGNLTWNANGTLGQLVITDTANTANDQTCTYAYDDLMRLKNAHCGTPWSQDFTYDAWGNINKSGSSNFSSQGGTGNHVPGFSYDGMGNVMNDGANTYTYDAEGRQITVNGNAITLDAFSRAIEIQSGTNTYGQVVYSPSGLKFAFMNGTTLTRYIDPMVAGMAAVHVHGSPDSGYFQHADWLGSSRWGQTGNAVYDRAYAPFGEVYAELSGIATNRDFTGQREDTTPGLYDFLFRQYSPVQGRWLVPDPAGMAAVDITNPQTWNRYAYVANDPLNSTDPLGLQCEPYGCRDDGSLGLDFGMEPLGPGPFRIGLGAMMARQHPKYTFYAVVLAPYQIEDASDLAGGGGDDTSQTDVPPPLECNPGFIRASNRAWMRSGNGLRTTEGVFWVTGSVSAPTYTPLPNTNERMAMTGLVVPPNAVALVHTHPIASVPQPSGPDIFNSNKSGLPFYVLSIKGLWLHWPGARSSSVLRPGITWQKPC